METIRLAPRLHVPRVLMGLWQVADAERSGNPLDPEAAADSLEPLVEAGFTAFDVADHYGSAEIIAGVLRRRHPEVRVLTKWVAPPGVSARASVREAVERSLNRIGADRLDLLQFHAWRYSDPAWLDCMEHLAELQQEGLILALGVTNFDAAHLDLARANGYPIATNQVCCSLVDRRPAGPMREVAARRGVRLLAYGSLAGGLLSDRWLGAPAPPITEALTWSQMKYRRFIRAAGGWDRFQQLLRAARRVAEREGVPLAAAAARFVLDQAETFAVIVGVRPGGRLYLEENRRLMDFALASESRADLEAAAAKLEPIPGDCGDEYRRPPFLTAAGNLDHHVSAMPDPYPVRRVGAWAREVRLGDDAGGMRAIRSGGRIGITNATAIRRGRPMAPDGAAAQTHAILDRIEGALESLGADVEKLVEVRIAVRESSDARVVATAAVARHAASFVFVPEIWEDGACRVRIDAEARTGPS